MSQYFIFGVLVAAKFTTSLDRIFWFGFDFGLCEGWGDVGATIAR